MWEGEDGIFEVPENMDEARKQRNRMWDMWSKQLEENSTLRGKIRELEKNHQEELYKFYYIIKDYPLSVQIEKGLRTNSNLEWLSKDLDRQVESIEALLPYLSDCYMLYVRRIDQETKFPVLTEESKEVRIHPHALEAILRARKDFIQQEQKFLEEYKKKDKID